MPLKDVFSAIEKQTGFFVFYNKTDLNGTKPVSVTAQAMPLKNFLEVLLKDQPLNFRIDGKDIILSRKAVTTSLSYALPQEPVTGLVKDATGTPLIGASVKVKGTSKGTVTNAKGEFSIDAARGDVLLVSFIGFENKEIIVGEGDVLVMLNTSKSPLDEVQIIGYGTTTRRLNTGNTATLSAAEIAKQPVTNPLQALSGRVPGVYVEQSSGLPGAGVSVQIRGLNSIGAGNMPLYIIDGVPFSGSSLTQSYYAETSTSPLNGINPGDIGSIEILKDADATAIYGSRAANGVVLITTKKGKAGKTKVDLSFSTGGGKITRSPEMLKTPEYLALRAKAFESDGETPDEFIAPDLVSWDKNKNTDFIKYFLGGTARMTDGNVSLTGGNSHTRFLLSGTLHTETGVYPVTQRYNRGGVHVNLDHSSADKRFYTSFSAIYTADESRVNTADITSLSYSLPPNFELYEDGKINWLVDNPLGYLMQSQTSKMKTLVSNAVFRYEVMKGLSLKTSLGYSNNSLNERSLLPKAYQSPIQNIPTNDAQFGNKQNSSYIIEPQADYTVRFGKGKFNVLAGGTWQQNNTEGTLIIANDYASEALMQTPAAARNTTIVPVNILYRYQSFFSRVNYNWDNRYILNGTYRRDGSTRFSKQRQYGDFWAVGGAWLFSNETLVKESLPWLNHGKLRGSYAVVGNDQIADYGYLSTYKSTPRPYNGLPGLAPTRISNPDYSWEVSRKLEAALELSFLQDKIFFTAAWFRNRCGNQLVNYPLSAQSGFTVYQANLPALVENKGWEFELNTVNIKRADFKWTSALNLTIPRNTLLAFPGLAGSSYARDKVIGESLRLLPAFRYQGIDPQTGEALFEDVVKDGVLQFGMAANGLGDQISATDDPSFYGGWNNSFTYKAWQLDIFFQYVKKKDFNILYRVYMNPIGSMANQPVELAEGPYTPSTTPGVAAYDSYNYLGQSTAALDDASYLRLKNLSLSYSLPAAFAQRVKMEQLRIYARAQNLFTISRYLGFDPETSRNGLVALPPLRMITAGIQCSF